MAESILKQKSFELAKHVVVLCQALTVEQKEFVISKQLLRSGTAVGALIREAQNAESTKDFIHKLWIAQKECDETLYWMELLLETGQVSQDQFDAITSRATEVLRMLKRAIITTRSRYSKKDSASKKKDADS